MAERGVFVLHLQHQHRTAVVRHQRGNVRCNRADVAAHCRHVVDVILVTHTDIRLAQQVRRQPTVIPFATNIRAGPQVDPDALALTQADEADEIPVAGMQVEFTRLALQVVPHQINGDRVEAHRLRHADAMQPVLGRDPCRVHLAAADLQWLAIQHEAARGQFKLMWSAVGHPFDKRFLRMRRRRRSARIDTPAQRSERRQHTQSQKIPAQHRGSFGRLYENAFRCPDAARPRIKSGDERRRAQEPLTGISSNVSTSNGASVIVSGLSASSVSPGLAASLFQGLCALKRRAAPAGSSS